MSDEVGSAIMPSRVPDRIRRAVAARHGVPLGSSGEASCHWCGAPGRIIYMTLAYVVLDGLEWDHYLPLARGGSHDASNIVLACRPCNRSRRDRLDSEWPGSLL